MWLSGPGDFIAISTESHAELLVVTRPNYWLGYYTTDLLRNHDWTELHVHMYIHTHIHTMYSTMYSIIIVTWLNWGAWDAWSRRTPNKSCNYNTIHCMYVCIHIICTCNSVQYLLVVDLLSPLSYISWWSTHPFPVAGKLPKKTLVGRQLPTNKQTNIHTYIHTCYSYKT